MITLSVNVALVAPIAHQNYSGLAEWVCARLDNYLVANRIAMLDQVAFVDDTTVARGTCEILGITSNCVEITFAN